MAQDFYNEVMVRFLVRYSNLTDEDVYRTGFSKLLSYPEYSEVEALAASLSLFENTQGMRLLLRDSFSHDRMKFWIGDDLIPSPAPRSPRQSSRCPTAFIRTAAGAIGLVGPTRIPYGGCLPPCSTFRRISAIL